MGREVSVATLTYGISGLDEREETSPSVLRAASAQAGLSGAHDGLRPVGHLQLEVDVRDVVSYRLLAQVEARGDLLVVHAPGYEIQDLHLAGGEVGEGLGRRGRSGVAKKPVIILAILGRKWASPSATARRTFITSSPSAPLRT
jgi:hypothetical protein